MAEPPFPHYPGSAEAASDAGGQATNQQATFNALKTNLSTQNDAAAKQASGDLEPAVAAASQSPQNDAGTAAAASLVGGGAVNHFASAIKTYDGHVDTLNEQWNTALSNDFGVASDAGHKEGNTEAENNSARDGLVASARAALARKLESDRQGFENVLDDEADYSAALLIAGPTQSTVLSLFITGDIDINAASEALGMTIAALNNVRIAVGSVSGLVWYKDIMPALANYLLKMDPKKLAAGTPESVAAQLRNLVAKNAKPGTTMTFAQRVAAYKEAKPVVIRGTNLVKNTTPANLFGKVGADTKYFGTFSKVAGRALSPLAVVAGTVGLVNGIQNWDGSADSYNNVIGSGATVVSGGLGTAMMIAGAAGVAFPPAGAAIAIGAGVVALGSLAFTYRHEIWNGISTAGEWVGDRASDAWNATTDWASDVGSDIADGVDSALDTAGDVIDDITPW